MALSHLHAERRYCHCHNKLASEPIQTHLKRDQTRLDQLQLRLRLFSFSGRGLTHMDDNNSQATAAEFPHPCVVPSTQRPRPFATLRTYDFWYQRTDIYRWMLLPWPERQERGDYNPPPPRPRNELRMIALSAAIRAKPVRRRPSCPVIWLTPDRIGLANARISKSSRNGKQRPSNKNSTERHWLLRMSSSGRFLHALTVLPISMIDYVMDELQDYAKLVDEVTGIEVDSFGQKKNHAPCSPFSRSLVSMGPGTPIGSSQLRCGKS